MPKCNLNTDLEHLPKWENRAANLTRRFGNVYEVWDYRSNIYTPYKLAHYILEKNIGRSFNDAFSYFCKIFKEKYNDWDYTPYWYFMRDFEYNIRRYRYHSYYYTDDNGLIQKNKATNKRVYSI